MFELHPRLQADTQILGDLPLCRVLLAKDSQYPWLILVPRVAGLREIHHLAPAQQQQLILESCAVATLMEETLGPDKINVAALGNLVPQLHLVLSLFAALLSGFAALRGIFSANQYFIVKINM